MATLNGKVVVMQLSADGGTTYKLLVCETESGWSGTTETTTEQTKCDGGASVTAPGATSWTMTGSGVVKVSPETTEASFNELQEWWQDSTTLKAKLDAGAGAFDLVGDGYITSLDLSLPVGGKATFTMTFTGDGAITNTVD